MEAISNLFQLKLKQNPGTFEQLHKEARATLPTQYIVEGCKFDLASHHNPNFQTSHSFGFTHKQSQYHFGSVFANSRYILHGQVSGDGVLQARGHYNWIPAEQKDEGQQPVQYKEFQVQSTTKMQAQLSQNAQQNVIILEHEYLGENFSVGIKSQNANPVDKASLVSSSSVTGVFSASYLQQISKNLAIGAEYTYSRPFPDLEESSIAYGLKYTQVEELPKPLSLPPGSPSPYMPINPTDPTSVFTVSYTPASAMLHSSYWRRLNQRLEVVSEVQMLIQPNSPKEFGRREAIASVGFKLDTVFATIRSCLETSGKLVTVLEEKVTPNISFQVNAELDYAKGGVGKVGFGFTFEQ